MRKKKAQAAMEFLMTYGWAILVVLVVIAALAYFGVLNPQQFLPKKCQFSQGIVCMDNKIVEGGALTLRLNNGLGNDLEVNQITFDSDNTLVECSTGDDDLETVFLAGAELDFTVACGAGGVDNEAVKGSRIKGSMELTYENLQTQVSHTMTGTLLTDVE